MNANQRKQQQGFTLIELMIVVAIIGVLSAIAVPAYKNYVAKSEAASALATLKSLITPAELYIQEKGTFKTTDQTTLFTDVGISAGSNSLGSLSVSADNTIKFEFTSGSLAASGSVGTITYTKTSTGWVCTTANLSTAKPSGCS
ncbi:pilin [Vibrio fluvialis]|uniref:pilin n=1 Tax=Vibrio fluvialis TaxID=676 RepID=UPI00192AABA4|nr:pilin [Vibrio fluvialis]EKO3377742.1 prepilin-type N-terminal cleavage/methylation domain-containing protein [Vibrio fluvialis]EKO3431018.1 prepilin-type N-terminal cleavage/methylation domain-containing protein [Vibrio fluvialis]EKO3448146.1 prepilin-type N-terminal cleavage/methylation domain-containing protein [Vibrio fluvialis]EKO3465160.1 prepilin-type N-terminal cleavage/methylation domain-containing protein [Vibrio fluvialis]EKO5151964.1 prepilin-type N-terminal cleavage/methylation 